jgi:hypothetical protein
VKARTVLIEYLELWPSFWRECSTVDGIAIYDIWGELVMSRWSTTDTLTRTRSIANAVSLMQERGELP